mmetsp:Transcript_64793/g.163141  ORF Transcript_64793/g.163141 Transcript_64793/m.163141 type:complete len:110 (+) Transcript_64793:78-407(+)|eukprot:CAMPEP_0115270500 /NCGR_PEP_ID=MMETSP0270-20121206/53602_1 /TAXON_ID=71861 /ORGANISM="Scrippsiella trochoidea, Strain CCMP3099" /LENGTH=109 /DNA_ID=CAMNT_0002686803 /DNA_START=69 /DNA_END=398 /DNA_ORIENTATION=+
MTAGLRIMMALLLVLGAVLPPQAATSDIASDIVLDADDELDWTAGSVMGLQRGFKLHRKVVAPANSVRGVDAPAGTFIDASVLGLQRSVTVRKGMVRRTGAPAPSVPVV